MAHDVFISYASRDKAVADAGCAILESKKIRCWVAPRDVLPGQLYGEAIIEAITESKVMVLIFSAESNGSQQVMREVERAVNKGIPIIPFRIDNVEPTGAFEFFLSSTHWLDAMSPPVESHLEKLTQTVEFLLGQSRPPLKESMPAASREEATRAPYSKMIDKRNLTIAALFAVAALVVGLYLGSAREPVAVSITNPRMNKAAAAEYINWTTGEIKISGTVSGFDERYQSLYVLARLAKAANRDWLIKKVNVRADNRWSSEIVLQKADVLFQQDEGTLRSSETFQALAVVAPKETQVSALRKLKSVKNLPERLTASRLITAKMQFTKPLEQGNLRLSSVPLGARVYAAPYVSGTMPQGTVSKESNYKGLTPLSLNVEPGAYVVAFELPSDKVNGKSRFEGEDNFDSSFSKDANENLVKVARYYIVEVEQNKEKSLIGLFQPEGEPVEALEPFLPAEAAYDFRDENVTPALNTHGVTDIPRIINILHRGGKVVAKTAGGHVVIEMGIGNTFSIGELRE